MVMAAVLLESEKIARPWLVGSRSKIPQNLTCVDPELLSRPDGEALVETLLAMPKYRHLSREDALKKIHDPLVLACLFLKTAQVGGFVGGATRSTTDTLRAVLSIIGLSPQAPTLFGFFLIERRSTESTSRSIVLLADCAVIPDPSPKQLAQIAIGAAEAFKFFMQEETRVAFLSFSTLGSAAHPGVDKVRNALHAARERAPGICFEGEWQADAALDPFSAEIKGAGHSSMAGKANVLVVPDLNCGNIAYKLVQRLGQCRAVGPVLWGAARPANDLSRGCSTEDVVNMVALTALEAQAKKILS